jgi:hypothetical protein
METAVEMIQTILEFQEQLPMLLARARTPFCVQVLGVMRD